MIIARPLSGFLPLSGGTLTGPLFLNASQVYGQKTVAERSNPGAVTVAAGLTSIITVDCGTVATGDHVNVFAWAEYVKGATDGISKIRARKSAGTATVIAIGGQTVTDQDEAFQPATTTARWHLAFRYEVTAGGTLTMELIGSSTGSNSTVAIGQGLLKCIVESRG